LRQRPKQKGTVYTIAEVGEAIGGSADETKSVVVKAKADGVLKGNGKVGRSGRILLA